MTQVTSKGRPEDTYLAAHLVNCFHSAVSREKDVSASYCHTTPGSLYYAYGMDNRAFGGLGFYESAGSRLGVGLGTGLGT